MNATPLDDAPWRASTLGAITERLERAVVFDLAGRLEGRDVLDVGCGDGAYALAAARAGAHVTGLDRSAAALSAARARAEGEGLAVDLQVGDATDLPFPAARFDVIFAVTFAVGLGAACRATRWVGMPAVRALRDRFEHALGDRLGDRVTVSGAGAERLPNTANVNFFGQVGAEVLARVPGLAASTGSAATQTPSSSLRCSLRWACPRARGWALFASASAARRARASLAVIGPGPVTGQ